MAKPKRGRMVIPRQPKRLPEKFSNSASTPLPTTQSFIARPPLKIAREYATKEISDQATPAEIAWLYEHKVLWLRALHQKRLNLDNAIAQARLSLAPQRPQAGVNPTREYTAHKQQIDKENKGRLRIIRLVEQRIEEVASMCGPEQTWISGDVINVMVRLAQLIEEDDVGSAHDLALFYAEAWQQGKTLKSDIKKALKSGIRKA